MSNEKRRLPGDKTDPAAARRRRQAEALRANLRRRKAAAGDGEETPKKADKPRGGGD